MSSLAHFGNMVELNTHIEVPLQSMGKIVRSLNRLFHIDPAATLSLLQTSRRNSSVHPDHYGVLMRHDLINEDGTLPTQVRAIVLATLGLMGDHLFLKDPRLNPGPPALV